ncbi:hypothetical protein ID866_4898 [Astraeus odoratus]|nr:hypothetical protein ID866_4898 [Astraeus odoratus]
MLDYCPCLDVLTCKTTHSIRPSDVRLTSSEATYRLCYFPWVHYPVTYPRHEGAVLGKLPHSIDSDGILLVLKSPPLPIICTRNLACCSPLRLVVSSWDSFVIRTRNGYHYDLRYY